MDEGVARNFAERAGIAAFAATAKRPKLFAVAGKLMRGLARLMSKDGKVRSAGVPPLGKWTKYRDLPAPQGGSFRERWKKRKEEERRLENKGS